MSFVKNLKVNCGEVFEKTFDKGFDNEVYMSFQAKSENEAFARTSAAAFVLKLNPTIEEINDIKTAVSEAVTNAIIHGYEMSEGMVGMSLKLNKDTVYIEITDNGKGIEDIEKARSALFTSKPELERSGMGFTVMELFMDELEVISEKGKGTTVKMSKKIAAC